MKSGGLGQQIGRADLLRLLLQFGADSADAARASASLGDMCGYAWQGESAPPQAAAPPEQILSKVGAEEGGAPSTSPAVQNLRAQQYHAVLHQPEATPSDSVDWQALLAATENQSRLIPPSPAPARAVSPLSSTRRLAAACARQLRQPRMGTQLDIQKISQSLALCQDIDWRKMRQHKAAWRPNCLVLHLGEADMPQQTDYYRVARVAYRCSGGQTPVYLSLQGHDWFVKTRYQDHREWQILPQPPRLKGQTGIVLGQDPMTGDAALRAGAWRLLWSANPPPSASLPLIAWRESAALTPQRRAPAWAELAPEKIHMLLCLCSLSAHVEIALLRALRQLMCLPPAAESVCWLHADVLQDGLALALRHDIRPQYLRQLPDLPLELRQQAARLIAQHHAHLSFGLQLEDALCATHYAPGGEAFDPAPWYAQLAQDLRTPDLPPAQARTVRESAAFLGRQGWRSDSLAWRGSAEFTLAWAIAQRKDLQQGDSLPPEFPLAMRAPLCAALGISMPAPEHGQCLWRVLQCDGQAWVYAHPLTEPAPPRYAPELARWQGPAQLQWRVEGGAWQSVEAPEEGGILWAQIPLSEAQTVEIRAGDRYCTVEPVARPTWALEVGRDVQGGYALAPNPWGEAVRVGLPLDAVVGAVFKVESQTAISAHATSSKKKRKQSHQLHFMLSQSLALDAIGLYANLEVVGPHGRAQQVFRWIAAGSFAMGRPADEDGYDEETPQHEVQISQGFWLADTACTQALWQAIMGENPARFNAANGGGPEHPVEQVSWLDVQAFLQKLNAMLPGCGASLPTEAEWEYACRAGTTTPFHFGATVNPEQVNYDGNYPYPYPDGSKGEYRNKTVPVKALPANSWGLYQMHGNVWEWCADDRREYAAGRWIDPGLEAARAPPAKPARRALRGGTWGLLARHVRSAIRCVDASEMRADSTGFRLALRFPAGKGG
ncbi:formylglycine-generating enzyme family protein [Massilia sp. W12]|uniref:formylglycine-generating enzyme family protein n=1 Tax=Massilia sp. W12 TaxID=3126507 RepID=UPI0030CC1947